jgi:hypothetical protein
MQSLLVAWRLSTLTSIFVFPHLLAILLYLRLHRAPRWVAAIAGALAPAIIFFWLAPIFFFAGLREAYAHGERCGMPAMAATLMLLFGTGIQLVIGLITQAGLAAGRRVAK